MGQKRSPLRLRALELSGAAIRAGFSGRGQEKDHQPDYIRISPGGMFLHWPEAPSGADVLDVEWLESPFSPQPFRITGRVVARQDEGLEIEFDQTPPAAFQKWFEKVSPLLNQRQPDAALRTSKLYTSATVVSAAGLFCGALAILLPILAGQQAWLDLVSKVLLLLMVASIGGFAWIRVLAGREEIRAIGQSRV